MTFALHPQLDADTADVTAWPLSAVRLMNDARYPWLILVPRRAGIEGIHELEAGDRPALMDEITRASNALKAIYTPERLNVAALGNMVPQLHVHVIARQTDDPAWPGPVWGKGAAEPYGEEELAAVLAGLRAAFEGA